METYTNFASYNMALDDIDPAEIEEMLQQIQWEQSIDQQILAAPEYDTTNLDASLSPLSGYASPTSMTTGSTNQSPLVPFLDYDMSYPVAPFTEDPENLFPELMEHTVNMNAEWVGSSPEGYGDPFLTSGDAQLKVSSLYPGQLYPTASPQTTICNSNPATSPYTTTQSPQPATAQPTQTTQTAPSPSSPPQKQTTTTTTGLTCPHCNTTLPDKTKLKVHTNKHTKPFRCSAEGCGYATAEKKSLQRHLLARSRWDAAHAEAARGQGVTRTRHACPREGCTYATVREDNLKRHMGTCCARE